MGSVIKKRRKRMSKKKHRKLLRGLTHTTAFIWWKHAPFYRKIRQTQSAWSTAESYVNHA